MSVNGNNSCFGCAASTITLIQLIVAQNPSINDVIQTMQPLCKLQVVYLLEKAQKILSTVQVEILTICSS